MSKRSKLILALIGCAFAIATYGLARQRPLELTYALPEKSTWWIAPSMLATEWDYFTKENVEIKEEHWPTGKRALQALFDSQADIAFVAGPPATISVDQGRPIIVLAQTMTSRRIMHFLPWQEHVDDWFEHPIGLARGTISEFYLISHLKKIGKLDLYKSGKLKLVNRSNAEANFISLLQDTTKSIILFEPFASIVTMGDPASRRYVTISDPSIYAVNCFIVTTPTVWARKRTAILSALVAIRRASNEVQRAPQSAWKAIRPKLKFGEEAEMWGRRDWSSVDFNLVTDKARVRESLGQDGAIGAEAGLFKAVPDFESALSAIDEVDRHLRARGL